MENTPNNGKVVKPHLLRFLSFAKGRTEGKGRLPSWLKNKYFICFAAFWAVLFFMDKNDLFTQLDRTRELKNLRQSKQYYTDKIAAERKELEALKHNPAALEKLAREKYLMKRDNEELFIIQENYDSPKN